MATAMVATLALACGGSSAQKVVVDATPVAMRTAAQATLAKGTSKIDFSLDMPIGGQSLSMTGTGALDPANKRFEMSIDAKQLFAKLLSSKSDSIPPETQSLFDKPIDVIFDNSVIYMNFPALAAFTGGGKQWLKLDLAAANGDLAALMGNSGGGPFGSDPSAFLQFLEGVGKVTKVGTEQVQGLSTTHFSGSYTMQEALSQMPSDQRSKVEQAIKNLGIPADAETSEIPFDAWIDGDGLVRKFSTTIDLAAFGAPSGGSLAETIEFHDFGAPVDIKIPSDDEVQDFSALAVHASTKFSQVSSSIN